MSVYEATHRDIAEREAARAEATTKERRRRDLIHRSDVLLAQLEGLNLVRYEAVKAWRSLDDCRLTDSLLRVVNQLMIEVGMEARRLRTTREALEAVWAAQRRIFGQPDDDE